MEGKKRRTLPLFFICLFRSQLHLTRIRFWLCERFFLCVNVEAVAMATVDEHDVAAPGAGGDEQVGSDELVRSPRSSFVRFLCSLGRENTPYRLFPRRICLVPDRFLASAAFCCSAARPRWSRRTFPRVASSASSRLRKITSWFVSLHVASLFR